jgi:hypothetical protein
VKNNLEKKERRRDILIESKTQNYFSFFLARVIL